MRSILLLSLMVVTVTVSPALAFVLYGDPPKDGIALVIAPPWGHPIGQVLAASDMIDAFPARAPIGAFVVLENPASAAGLYANGAWFVVNGEWILELC